MTLAKADWRARSMPWSKTASTPSASTPTLPSAPLLARVSGIGAGLAQSIVPAS